MDNKFHAFRETKMFLTVYKITGHRILPEAS